MNPLPPATLPDKKNILGLDLGATSIGWALVETARGVPVSLLRAGSRIFDADLAQDVDAGREEPRGQKRRAARQQRRQIWRRARRSRRIFRLLQCWGLLPPGDASSPEKRQALLNSLDEAILKSDWYRSHALKTALPDPHHVMPYALRAAALDMPLDPFYLGRAFYHLSQRRGFLSNRRLTAAPKTQEDTGAVKEGIRTLRGEIVAAGARTLGEYFSRLRPAEKRIRTRYTHRQMFKDEFEKIWIAQTNYNPGALTEQRKKALQDAIFYQRPLRFPVDSIGRCELEPEQYRAPKHILISQRFRLLQTLNNLRIVSPYDRELTAEERSALLDRLETMGDLTFAEARKLLGLPKCKFNLEAGGEKRLPGNRTNAAFLEVFGEHWKAMSAEEKNAAVEYVWSFQKPDKLPSAAAKKWGLSPEAADKLSQIPLEADRLAFSAAAMRKMLPLLDAGKTVAETRRELYPEQFQAADPLPFLPPVQEWKPGLRNPAVVRCLTEARKIVNALIRESGTPSEIRIELARDLRNPRWLREQMSLRNRERAKEREKAARRILQECPGYAPSGRDILKVLLAEECRWECPYTAKPIAMRALVGHESQFDIEHILPFSKSLDNSFANLTLCDCEHNHNVKQRRAPSEAYGSSPDVYQAILDRVRRFTGTLAKDKLRRFLMTPEEIAEYLSKFEERLLNDTRYATRLAAEYLSLLYGGRVDTEGKRRIRTTSGQVTAMLRDEWELNAILNDGATSKGGRVPKSRGDHRHHAVDAIVTALTGDGTIQTLSRAAERAPLERRRRFASLEEPWPNFISSVREHIDRVVVSHRVSRKVRGALHEETIYSAPISIHSNSQVKSKKKADQEHRVRKPLSQLTSKEAAEIGDPCVRKLVLARLAEYGGDEPKKVFADESRLPSFETRDGRRIPIRCVRVRKPVPIVTLGTGHSTRHVTPESNHHVEIFAELDGNGRDVGWDGAVASLLEASTRMRRREPVIQRNHGLQTEFRFSLAPNEVIEADDERNGKRGLFLVRGCTQEASGSVRIFLSPIQDARKKDEQVKDDAYLRPSIGSLRKWNARKVRITPLGDVVEAHD